MASFGHPATADQADRLVFLRLAQMEVRRPEERVIASFTEAAGEDPLDDLGDEA